MKLVMLLPLDSLDEKIHVETVLISKFLIYSTIIMYIIQRKKREKNVHVTCDKQAIGWR